MTRVRRRPRPGRVLGPALAALLLLAPHAPAGSLPAPAPSGEPLAPHAPDRVLVAYHPDTPRATIHRLEASVDAVHHKTLLGGDVRSSASTRAPSRGCGLGLDDEPEDRPRRR